MQLEESASASKQSDDEAASALHTQLEERDSEMTELRTELQESAAALQASERSWQALESDKAALDAARAELQASKAALEAQLAEAHNSLDVKVVELAATHADLDKVSAELQAQRDAASANGDEQLQSMQQLQAELQQAQAACEEFKRTNTELARIVDALEAQVEQQTGGPKLTRCDDTHRWLYLASPCAPGIPKILMSCDCAAHQAFVGRSTRAPDAMLQATQRRQQRHRMQRETHCSDS